MKLRAAKANDKVLKAMIHERDNWQCVVPVEEQGKHGGALQAAHVHPKGKYRLLRHVADNLLSMCYRHHIHWQHKDPIGFTDWFRRAYPERAAYLHKLTLMDKTALRAELEREDE